MKKKNKNKKNILLGTIIGVLAVGVVASVGSLLNERNGWWDNLKSDVSDKLTPDDSEKKELNVNDLEVGTYTEDIEVGYYTIHATVAKSVVVEAQEKTYEDLEFTNRLKFGGSGSETYRSISIEVKEESSLSVWFRSPTVDVIRSFGLYDEDGELIETFNSNSEASIVEVNTNLDVGSYVIYGSEALDFYRLLLDEPIEVDETVDSTTSSADTSSAEA